MGRAICVLVLLTSFVNPALAQPSAVPVGTVKAERKAVAKALDFVGRIEAVNRVDVRARITGYLEAVLFKEGDLIKEGAPLFRIEKGQFEAAVQVAEGALARSQAEQVLAEQQLQRAEDLLARKSGTVVARDQAQAAVDTAKGNILTNQGNLQNARINLGYTDVLAPISGKIGRASITKGNVVSPESGVLTMIVSQDPMYVTFPVSQRDLLRARGAPIDLGAIKIIIRFADGSTYDQVGKVNFIDVTVDRTTDTVLARATMPNPRGALIDGQFVRVHAELGSPEEKVVIPQAALIADQQGMYVFVVEDGKAIVKRVKAGGESGTGVMVEEGLTGGELVIVEGLQSLRAGMPVRAAPLSGSLSGS